MSRIVTVSTPWPASDFFDFSYVRNPVDPKAVIVPPVMVTDKSALFVIAVTPRHWKGVRNVACYRLRWEGKDCFFLAPTEHLTLPMTPQKLYDHSVLILTAGGREVVKNRYFDEDGESLLAAVEPHLDVEFVHAL